MRFSFLVILALVAEAGWSAPAVIHPCAAELDRVETAEGQISDSTTHVVELRSKSASEESNRANLLASRVQEANAALDGANRTALQDTRLLQMLIDAKSDLDAWSAGGVSPGFDRALAASLIAQKDATLAGSVQFTSRLVLEPSAGRFAQMARTLESSREWNAQMKDIRERAESGEALVGFIANRMSAFAETLQAALAEHPRRMAQLKTRLSEAQAAVEASSLRQGDLDQKRQMSEKRLQILKENLPGLRQALNACMHRAQFGN